MKVYLILSIMFALLAFNGCKPQNQLADTSRYDGENGENPCSLSYTLTEKVIGALYTSQSGGFGLSGVASQPLSIGEIDNIPRCDSDKVERVERAFGKINFVADACGPITQIDQSSGHGGYGQPLYGQLVRNGSGGLTYNILIKGKYGFKKIQSCSVPEA